MEIRRSYDRLISTMGFPILVRRHLYIESGPRLSAHNLPVVPSSVVALTQAAYTHLTNTPGIIFINWCICDVHQLIFSLYVLCILCRINYFEVEVSYPTCILSYHKNEVNICPNLSTYCKSSNFQLCNTYPQDHKTSLFLAPLQSQNSPTVCQSRA